MFSSFSFPILEPQEIVGILSEWEIADVRLEDLSGPTPDFVYALYASLLKFLDPLGHDPGQLDFDALQLLENPDAYANSIHVMILCQKMNGLVSSACSANFTLKDLLSPRRDRTIKFISGIINFCFFRSDKMNLLQPAINELTGLEERRSELETKISELNKEISYHEETLRVEQPAVLELGAEVRELKQRIESLNKQQMSLKVASKSLKDKIEEINNKSSKAEYELVTSVQENSKLRSEIVQSPDKLQRALEEKKSILAQAQNSERYAKQCYQEKAATLEIYSKACKKLLKHLVHIQDLQEQVNKVKDTDKDIRRLKAQLNGIGESDMDLEAKLVERQGKVKQVEEYRKAIEKEKIRKHMQATEELNRVKAEVEAKFHDLEPRKRNIEQRVAEADNVNSEICSVKEAGAATRHKLDNKCEEIVAEVHIYSNSIDTLLDKVKGELECDISTITFSGEYK